MSAKRAEEKSNCPRYCVQKEETRRTVQFFERRAKLHERHHVKADVNQAAVQEHGRDQSPPLMAKKNRWTVVHPKPVGGNSIHVPENVETSSLSGLDSEHELDRKQKEIQAEKDSRDGRCEAGYGRQFFCNGGERKGEAGPALVATGGSDSDEGAAGGAESWTALVVAASENATDGMFPAFETHLPAIG